MHLDFVSIVAVVIVNLIMYKLPNWRCTWLIIYSWDTIVRHSILNCSSPSWTQQKPVWTLPLELPMCAAFTWKAFNRRCEGDDARRILWRSLSVKMGLYFKKALLQMRSKLLYTYTYRHRAILSWAGIPQKEIWTFVAYLGARMFTSLLKQRCFMITTKRSKHIIRSHWLVHFTRWFLLLLFVQYGHGYGLYCRDVVA